MKLFRRRVVEKGIGREIVTLQSSPMILSGPDYTAGRDESRYRTSPSVRAAVSVIAENAATVPFKVLVGGEAAPDHPLQRLLDTCNNVSGPALTWTQTYTYLLTGGETFLLLDRVANIIRELYPVPGSQVTIRLDGGEQVIAGYTFTNGRRKFNLDRLDCVPVILPNPTDRFKGLSPLSSLRHALDAEAEAWKANASIFANGLMADAVIVAPNGMSEEQRQILNATLQARKATKHGSIFLPAEATITRLDITPKDAEFLGLCRQVLREVARVYKVPPMFLGDLEDATYSNFEQGQRSFWENAVLPVVGMLAGALTVHLAVQYGPTVTVEPDLTGVEALRENEKTKAETAKVRAETFGTLLAAGANPAWALQQVYGEEVDAAEALLPPQDKAIVNKAARDRRLYRLTTKARNRCLPLARRLLTKALQEQEEQALALFDLNYPQAKDVADVEVEADSLASLLFSAVTSEGMETAVETIITTGAETGATATSTIFDLAVDSARVTPQVQRFVENTAARKVQQINDTTRSLIREGIAQALESGEGLEGVRLRIQQAFRGSDEPTKEFWYDDRVENIAQTELTRAYNYGAVVGMREAGITKQEWLGSGLPGSRHGDINGQTTSVGGHFSVHGHAARYPGDEALPIREAARCACTVVPYEPAEERDLPDWEAVAKCLPEVRHE